MVVEICICWFLIWYVCVFQLQQLIQTLQQAGGAGLPQSTAPPPEQKPSLAKVSSLNDSVCCFTTILTLPIQLCLVRKWIEWNLEDFSLISLIMLFRNHRVNTLFGVINLLPVTLYFWFDSVSAGSIWLWRWPWTCGGKDWTSSCSARYYVGHNKLISFCSHMVKYRIDLILSFFTETYHQNYSKPFKLIFWAKSLTRYLLWHTELLRIRICQK